MHLQGIAGEGVELGSTAETECGAESIAAIEDRKGPEGEHHTGMCHAWQSSLTIAMICLCSCWTLLAIWLDC